MVREAGGNRRDHAWVRDGFSAPESSVLADIRKLSTDDATLHLFLPKSHADELKNAIASAQATEETLHFKGNPTSDEGKECRHSMMTKQNTEGLRIEELIGQISVAHAYFFPEDRSRPLLGSRKAWKMPPNRSSIASIPNFTKVTPQSGPRY